MLVTPIPIKTYRGTMAEILAHQHEIPADSVVEVRVYQSLESGNGASLADSLAGLIEESKHVQRGEPIRYSNQRQQAFAQSVREKFQGQGFGQ